MIYYTLNDRYSGVFESQVIDLCDFLGEINKQKPTLISQISIRNFLKEKKKLKKSYSPYKVIPMYPGFKNWEKNILLLQALFLIPKNRALESIYSRGAYATWLAIKLKEKNIVNKVCYDGRGAVCPIWEEYDIGQGKTLTSDKVFNTEKKAVLDSDIRIAVSHKLVEYWRNKFNYKGIENQDHFVIPSTLNSSLLKSNKINYNERRKIREKLGFNNSDTIFIFSGKASPWNSLELVDEFLLNTFKIKNTAKALFLTNSNISDMQVYKQFYDRIVQKWVSPQEVKKYISSGDYGLLLRHSSTTNKVASPVKFPEYLNAGLKVIISSKIGELSKFVKNQNCGLIYSELKTEMIENLTPTDENERAHSIELARSYFSKSSYKDKYSMISNLLEQCNKDL